MNQYGAVSFRTLWSNDEAILRDGLEAVVQGRNAGERQPHLVPMVKGMGSMDEVLGLAGQQARRDAWREVPPMYLMARLASLFRPLPPLAEASPPCWRAS